MTIDEVIPFMVSNSKSPLPGSEHGYANGYVAVGPHNKFYRKSYIDSQEVQDLDVHGGITFTEPVTCGEYSVASKRKIKDKYVGMRTPILNDAIYLTDKKEIPDDWWVLGFDTFHWEDNTLDQNEDYCKNETMKLAKQVSE